MTEYILPRGYLSFSQVRRYLECPACYEAKYVEDRRETIGSALPVGAAIHGAFQQARYEFSIGPTKGSNWAAAAIDELRQATAGINRDNETPKEPPVIDWTPYANQDEAEIHIQAIVGDGDLIASIVTRELRYGNYLGVESALDYADLFPFPVKGWADAILGNGTVKELKTAKDKRTPDDWLPFQLALQSMPLLPDVQVAWDTLIKQYPYDVVSGGPVRIPIEQYEAVRQTVVKVAESITAGVFPPRLRGLGWADKRFHSGYDHGLPRTYFLLGGKS